MRGDDRNAPIGADALSRRRRGRASVVVLAVALAGAVSAQGPRDRRVAHLARLGAAHEVPEGGYLGLSQAVRDARNDRVVAVVASHPDDQYVLPATYLRLNGGYRVTAILLTRGEGGQNSEGPEVGDALGALRTAETADCARRLGLEVEHLNLPDGGYCRTGEEALQLWGRREAIDALARALRRIRPDVVLTTHHPREIHGHDLALLDILPVAVARASDPAFRVDGLAPVAIDRVYRGTVPDASTWLFALPTCTVDPDRGETYRKIAYDALTGAHRSQAPFRPLDDLFEGADHFVGVSLPGSNGRLPPAALYEGLPDLFRSLAGVVAPERIADLRRRIDVELPATVHNLPRLAAEALRLRDELSAIEVAAGSDAAARIARRIDALERIALHAVGIRAEIHPTRDVIVAGETLGLVLVVSCTGQVPVRALHIEPVEPGAAAPRTLAEANLQRPQPWRIVAEIAVPADALRDDPLRDLFQNNRFRMPLRVALRIGIGLDDGTTAEIIAPLEVPVDVRPAVELSVHPRALLVPDGKGDVRFNARVRRNTAAPLIARLLPQLPPGFDAEPGFIELDLRSEPEQGYLFRLHVPAGMRPGPQPVRVRVGDASARVEMHRVPMTFPRDLRVGLIEGVDDAARTLLSQVGCDLVVLGEGLQTRALDDLDTILVDIRALRHHAVARAEFNRLLGFAANGGRLVVLYHKDAEFDVELTGQRFFPRDLPLRIGKGRVTREDAPVVALQPDHPLLNQPNRIRSEDWDGWTQERGLYFASSWADGYTPLLRIADPGEPAEDGALLFASTGRGEFVYCALALHRQIKNLHPGACRLFANLVAHRRADR